MLEIIINGERLDLEGDSLTLQRKTIVEGEPTAFTTDIDVPKTKKNIRILRLESPMDREVASSLYGVCVTSDSTFDCKVRVEEVTEDAATIYVEEKECSELLDTKVSDILRPLDIADRKFVTMCGLNRNNPSRGTPVATTAAMHGGGIIGEEWDDGYVHWPFMGVTMSVAHILEQINIVTGLYMPYLDVQSDSVITTTKMKTNPYIPFQLVTTVGYTTPNSINCSRHCCCGIVSRSGDQQQDDSGRYVWDYDIVKEEGMMHITRDCKMKIELLTSNAEQVDLDYDGDTHTVNEGDEVEFSISVSDCDFVEFRVIGSSGNKTLAHFLVTYTDYTVTDEDWDIEQDRIQVAAYKNQSLLMYQYDLMPLYCNLDFTLRELLSAVSRVEGRVLERTAFGWQFASGYSVTDDDITEVEYSFEDNDEEEGNNGITEKFETPELAYTKILAGGFTGTNAYDVAELDEGCYMLRKDGMYLLPLGASASLAKNKKLTKIKGVTKKSLLNKLYLYTRGHRVLLTSSDFDNSTGLTEFEGILQREEAPEPNI